MKQKKPTVVIIGAGFAGVRAAQALKDAPVNVVLIDRRNYHLFQPLLYQIAMATLNPGDVAYPVRGLLQGQKNIDFKVAEVEKVDFTAKKVETSHGDVSYDYLIVAAGSMTNYFGMHSIADNAFGLKNLEDAVSLRNHILTVVDEAVQEQDEEKRKALLSFVIVGGGPTGVESAGALSELMQHVITKDYPNFNANEVKIILMEAIDNLLTVMPQNLRAVTARKLQQKGVEVRFGAKVVGYDGTKVSMHDGEEIPAHTLLWAAGIQASSIVQSLGVELGSFRRAKVTATLQLADYPEVFAVGDAAHFEQDGRALPTIAPVANQMADVAVRNIEKLIKGEKLESFRYKPVGSLAIIGRGDAVASMGSVQFSGFFAWAFWLVVHAIRLAGTRNRVSAAVSWFWEYFSMERGVRINTSPMVRTDN